MPSSASPPRGGREALSHALTLAAQGFAVFPCHASKAPATPRGFHDAARGAQAIRALWARHPGPLVGVATGAAGAIAVLDVDNKATGAAWFAENRAHLPRTRTHRTRGGGLHLVFRHSPGLRCSAGRIAPGIDVRAEGGFIIWWPAAGLPVLDGAAFAPWPAWLLGLAMPPPKPAPAAPPTFTHISRYAEAALRHASGRMRHAVEGERNATLFREAAGLGRLDALPPDEIARALGHAAFLAGLGPREIEQTLVSALRAKGVI